MGSFFSSGSQKKADLQNLLDVVLKIAYPFISEGYKYTSSLTKLTKKDCTLKIKIDPKYIPFGSEDMTEIVIGVLVDKNGRSQVMKTNIWRTETEVFSLYGGPKAKIRPDSDIISMTVNVPNDLIVLAGDGTMEKGECLGLYHFDTDHGCYKQVATEEHCNPAKRRSRYIYRASNEVWNISRTPGETTGLMKNTSKSVTLPLTGWMFVDNKDNWCSDPSVKIQFGSLLPNQQCGDVRIQLRGAAADKWPECGGLFTKTDKYFYGKPVFVNTQSEYLHCSGVGTWSVGSKIGEAGIRSTSAGLCPAQIKTWTYFTGSEDKPADVTISCSNCSK